MGINLIWTFIVLISIILFDNKDVSYYILSGMIVFNILISLWVYFRNMHLIKNHKNTDICTGYGMQINIMITTQLERMLIGIIFPTFLGVISIVASICQGWRKIVLDDAILFERLTLARNVLEVTKNHFWFYAKNSIPMLMLLFFSLFFTDNLNMLLPRNLDSYNLIYLGIIYMIALPAGIVTINLIRSNIYSPSIFSYSYTILVMSYLSVMLIISKYISIDMKYVWLIISSTAMINIVLYIDFLFTFKDKK